MFAGIGGFRAGLDRAGGFQCIGHCEIDKYADASYRAIHDPGKEELYYPDARKIDPNDLPDFDLLCGGFPCQAFSQAGRRRGFEDARGTLFFEVARLAQAKRPSYLLLENVPGLLSHEAMMRNKHRLFRADLSAKAHYMRFHHSGHAKIRKPNGFLARQRRVPQSCCSNMAVGFWSDKGRTFSAILTTLLQLGYSVEWMVLIRFFIPNGFAIWNAPGILPGGAADAARKDVQFQSLQTIRFAATALLWQLLLNTFNSNLEIGIHSADFGVPQARRRVFLIGYLDPRCAGKVFPLFGSGGKALIQMLPGPQGSRVYDSAGVACTQTAGAGGKGGKTGLYFIDLSTVEPRVTDQARCITAHYSKGPISNRRGEHSGVLLIREDTKKGYKAAYPGDTVSLGFPGTLHRGRVGHDIAHTLDTGAHQGVVMRSGWIRKLMPRECFRLQGFTDEQIDRVLAITSDAQAYKQAGNGVTVNVIEAIGRRIREMDEELKSEAIA